MERRSSARASTYRRLQGVVDEVGDGVVGVPCGAGGAPGDGGGVARAAHRLAGDPCRRVLSPSAEDPFAAAAQQLDQRQHPLVLTHSGFLFVDDGFSGRARRSRFGPAPSSRRGWFGGRRAGGGWGGGRVTGPIRGRRPRG